MSMTTTLLFPVQFMPVGIFLLLVIHFAFNPWLARDMLLRDRKGNSAITLTFFLILAKITAYSGQENLKTSRL